MSFGVPVDLQAGPPRWLWPMLALVAGLAGYAITILSLPFSVRLPMLALLVLTVVRVVHRLKSHNHYQLRVASTGVLRLQQDGASPVSQVVTELDHVWLGGGLAMLSVRTAGTKVALMIARTNNEPDQFRRFSVWLRFASPELPRI